MNAISHPSAPSHPPAAISRVLSRYSRGELEGFIEVAIGLLDLTDGDPDMEDANDVEDDFSLTDHALGYGERRGPGCEVSDAGGGNVEDQGEAIDEREPEHEGGADYGSNQDAPISDSNPVIC
ncbi:hypothetical protein [Sphingobium tyrosinilyticum]|uniref:Uncharacterized protein n=1 Tax=Sphingobium tyrosinilyticum TaxID=2715436 RepID=A0ABV9EZX8_9SPHN